MDEEVQKEVDEKEFLARKAEQEKKDAEKTEKNRAKRAKALARKKGKKGGKDVRGGEEAKEGGKRKLVPNANGVDKAVEDEDKEEDAGEARNAEEIGLVIEDDD